jgi:hypothetical protein
MNLSLSAIDSSNYNFYGLKVLAKVASVSAICLLASLIKLVNLLTSVLCSSVLFANSSSAWACFYSKSATTSSIPVNRASTGPYVCKCSSAKPSINPPHVLDFLSVEILVLSALDKGLC